MRRNHRCLQVNGKIILQDHVYYFRVSAQDNEFLELYGGLRSHHEEKKQNYYLKRRPPLKSGSSGPCNSTSSSFKSPEAFEELKDISNSSQSDGKESTGAAHLFSKVRWDHTKANFATISDVQVKTLFLEFRILKEGF